MLHHDNAPCHTAISVNKFLAKKGISVVLQPPYSPDLSPCDFSRGHFHMKTSNTATGSGSNVSGSVSSEGNYFEGEKVDL
jgi:hypothetical protein